MKIMNKAFRRHLLPLAVGGLCLYSSTAALAGVCTYTVNNEWGSGFVATIRIENNGNTVINGWQVGWEYEGPSRVTNLWNANNSGSNPYSASSLNWNGTIQPGESVEFGFQGVKNGGASESPVVTGDVCGGAINQAPVADAQATPQQGTAPLRVQFDASDSFDPDNDFSDLSFVWTFGDGQTSTNAVVAHTYSAEGEYPVTLQVSDGMLSDTVSLMISVEEDMVDDNEAPEAAISVNRTSGRAPLRVNFDGTGSSDPDNGPQALSYRWNFDDGETSTAPSPSHRFTNDGVYNVTLTVSDGEDSDTATQRIVVDSSNGSTRADNPFRNETFYVNPDWSAQVAMEPGGQHIANLNTAVWMDRIGAITDGRGLRGHLDEALAQNAGMFMFVVYNLPNRDCAALASSGELRISENGYARYQNEYIAPIVEIISDPQYRRLNIVAIVEVDSLPNLVTNLNVPDCQEANGPGGYRDGIRHALNQLSTVPNVYSYLDVAHSGWLGWSENFASAIDLIGDVVESTDKGWNSVAGFVTNTANYTPTVEPFLLDPALTLSNLPIRSSSFYEWNNYFDEKSFAQAWREAMIARGAPSEIGMLIDTARNGWGGPMRPEEVSRSTDIDTYVNESRIDKRLHRGNWCNQPGGIGFKPWADPYDGIDAFVWVKPPGESDGISDANFPQDPNDPAKRHDPMCSPTGSNTSDPSLGTGALPNAPHAGRWFPENFQLLIDNAYPAVEEPAGPPPPPPPPRSDCPGLNSNDPVVISQSGVRVDIDLGCAAPIHVRFDPAIQRSLFVENSGGEFDVTIQSSQGSTQAQGHFQSIDGLAGVTSITVTRNEKATAIQLRIN